jgi:hypothetical protein
MRPRNHGTTEELDMSTKNRLAIVGLAAGLLGGGAAGIALTSPGLAVGQTADSNSNTDDPTAEGTDRLADFLNETLAPLVADGTITQAQADAVIKALEDARPERPFGPGRGMRIGPIGDVFRAAADTIGVSAADLRAALADGQTIAEVADAHNVAASDVVDAMVAEIKTRLDEAVANGDLTQAEADEHLADAKEHTTDLVNGDVPRFDGRGPFGRDGNGDPNDDNSNGGSDNSDTDAENTSAAV